MQKPYFVAGKSYVFFRRDDKKEIVGIYKPFYVSNNKDRMCFIPCFSQADNCAFLGINNLEKDWKTALNANGVYCWEEFNDD